MPTTSPSSADSELIFGTPVHDPLRWLEDASEERVKQWVAERDAHARAHLAGLPERGAFANRLTEVMYMSSNGLPLRRGSRLFTSKRKPTDEKSVYYVQEGQSAPRVLIDPHTLSSDGTLRVSGLSPSRDGRWMAYLEQPNSADEATIRVKRVDDLQVQETDTITGVRHTSIAWNHASDGFYYTWLPPQGSVATDERLAHAEPRFHRLGTDPGQDVRVFPPSGDASKFIGAFESFDGRYLFVTVHSGWDKTQVFFRPTAVHSGAAEPQFVEFAPGKDAVFHVSEHRGDLYVLTNLGAPRFRLLKTSAERPAEEHWREIVSEADGVLEGFDILGDRLVLQYARNAYSELQLHDLEGNPKGSVPLPGIGSVTGVSALPDSDVGYFAFSSFTHPAEIFELNVKSNVTRRFARDEVEVDPSLFEVNQHWYLSKDGTRVSMFIVHRRGTPRDGKNPTLLTGYGGFSASMSPWFSADLYPWLERGGVYALPNLRGGGEYGEAWHQAGMRDKKQNVFDDFVAAAEYLVSEGYTSPSHLGIRGGSNGGLLVGAALTQRPDLFGAVVCNVPLLDMVRYHKFGLGRAWIPEYGNPDVEEEFRWLLSYSPYHRLTEGVKYPPLLMMSADTDDRVDPMHARKFVGKLLAFSETTPEDALLWVEHHAGHGGADLRRAAVERRADEYAFLWQHLAGQ